jgi:hypothetical protein
MSLASIELRDLELQTQIGTYGPRRGHSKPTPFRFNALD